VDTATLAVDPMALAGRSAAPPVDPAALAGRSVALAVDPAALTERSAALTESIGAAGKGVYGPGKGVGTLRSRIRTIGRPVFAPSNPPVATA
jgi:hypothetical protein